MALKRVYLDQRDWVALARQHYGRSHDEEIAGVLAMVREASESGHASFPLSAVHYQETYHQRNPDKRRRLGAFMADISRYHTIAGAPDLLAAEVHVAVSALTGTAPNHTPVPFGRGAKHAFQQMKGYFTDPETERRAIARFGAEAVSDYFERALLMGPEEQLPCAGIALPTREFSQHQLDFERETARKLGEWGHTSDRAHRLVLAQEAHDIIAPLNAEIAAGSHIRALVDNRSALTDFMMSLPAKAAFCRMRMSAHEDANFRWHLGDLNDVTALGTAAAYCDIVVAEKHWGSILRRHALYLTAQVTSDLRDLPQLLLK
ncbi:hypothetical protein ACFVS7_27675 [Streptomyces rubiginosohelvolus]|uniref:hypothetical protein n=1 Tax=Streptomyces rubiginosohelvolus TaxID=67362 RepID=UPI003684CFC0